MIILTINLVSVNHLVYETAKELWEMPTTSSEAPQDVVSYSLFVRPATQNPKIFILKWDKKNKSSKFSHVKSQKLTNICLIKQLK